MEHTNHISQDEGLRGNEKIEEAIAALQQELSADMLAHTLTVVRRRMREQGQFILALETPGADEQLKVRAVKTEDGKLWWAAFTSFEEEMRGAEQVQSTFMADIGKLLETALTVPEIEGITIEVPAQNKIVIHGCDKQKVGQFAAEVREKRPPEPYKGKGIKYADEVIRRKVGKTGAKK